MNEYRKAQILIQRWHDDWREQTCIPQAAIDDLVCRAMGVSCIACDRTSYVGPSRRDKALFMEELDLPGFEDDLGGKDEVKQ